MDGSFCDYNSHGFFVNCVLVLPTKNQSNVESEVKLPHLLSVNSSL